MLPAIAPPCYCGRVASLAWGGLLCNISYCFCCWGHMPTRHQMHLRRLLKSWLAVCPNIRCYRPTPTFGYVLSRMHSGNGPDASAAPNFDVSHSSMHYPPGCLARSAIPRLSRGCYTSAQQHLVPRAFSLPDTAGLDRSLSLPLAIHDVDQVDAARHGASEEIIRNPRQPRAISAPR